METMVKDVMRLQGIGLVTGTPASDVKIGDTLIWNYGYTSTVEAIEPVGTTMLAITERQSNGYVGTRRVKRTRLVCVRK